MIRQLFNKLPNQARFAGLAIVFSVFGYFFGGYPGSFAQQSGDSDKLAVATEVMKLGGFERAARTYMAEYARLTVESWKTALKPTDAETEKLLRDEFAARLTADYLKTIPDLTALYAKHFTIEEIRGLREFYKSSLGKALLSKMPLVEEELAKQFYPRLFSSTERHWYAVIDELRARGKDI